MSDIKEFAVDSRDFFGKSMQYAQEFLNSHKKINIVGTSLNVNQINQISRNLKKRRFC